MVQAGLPRKQAVRWSSAFLILSSAFGINTGGSEKEARLGKGRNNGLRWPNSTLPRQSVYWIWAITRKGQDSRKGRSLQALQALKRLQLKAVSPQSFRTWEETSLRVKERVSGHN